MTGFSLGTGAPWLRVSHSEQIGSGARLHFFGPRDTQHLPIVWMLSATYNQTSSTLPLVNVVGTSKNKMWLVVLFSYLMLNGDGQVAQDGPSEWLSQMLELKDWLICSTALRGRVRKLGSCIEKSKESQSVGREMGCQGTERSWHERWGSEGPKDQMSWFLMVLQLHFTYSSCWNGATLPVLRLRHTCVSPSTTVPFSLR